MNKNNFKIAVVLGVFLLQTSVACSMGRRLPVEESNDSSNTPNPTQPSQPVTPPPVSAADVVPLWETKATDGRAWTSHVSAEIDRLGQNLIDVVPADTDLFCPKFARLSDAQRKQFWIYMMSAMVRFESNFKPSLKFTEGFSDSAGKAVISRGLLQLSIESGNAYGCGFKNTDELHDPLKNLSCGIRILDRWVGRDGRIAGKVGGAWRGGARYWSVLRAGDKESYKFITSSSHNLSICK